MLFISYSHVDATMCTKGIANHLKRRAEKLGYRVWWDEHLQPGRPWSTQLEQQLNQTGAAIFW
ncbi:MAG: toll/interleukin-1 receptor domain-containing protein [Ilumatobacteraceae bacterium]